MLEFSEDEEASDEKNSKDVEINPYHYFPPGEHLCRWIKWHFFSLALQRNAFGRWIGYGPKEDEAEISCNRDRIAAIPECFLGWAEHHHPDQEIDTQ